MAEVLRDEGVGQIEESYFIPEGSDFGGGFGHYAIKTDSGERIDVTNPFDKGEYTEAVMLKPTEKPELSDDDAKKWLRRNVLEQ